MLAIWLVCCVSTSPYNYGKIIVGMVQYRLKWKDNGDIGGKTELQCGRLLT